MRTIKIILLVLLTGFVFAGCTMAPKGTETGISYVIKSYLEIQQSQYAVNVGFTSQVSAKPKMMIAQPVTAQLPAGKGIDNQKVVKKVFLTFDDGPEATITPAILDTLDRYGVKATFFVIGTCVEKNPAILKEIVKRGHAVGNHTYNHKYRDLYTVKGGFLKSLKHNGELIYGTIGIRPNIVRDPGGKVRNNRPLRKTLAENKYLLVEWNVDSYDSRKPYMTTPQIIENVRLQTGNTKIWDNMIILLHDGKGHINTVKALPAIIEMLKNQGFSFEVVR